MIDAVVAGRTGPEGVRKALMSSSVRRAVRQALGGLLSPAAASGPRRPSATLGRCRLVRVKFKPGRKLTATYTASVGDATAGRRGPNAVAVCVTWVPPDALTPLSDDYLAVEDDARARQVAGPFHGLVDVVPLHGMTVLVSPLDPVFPQLVKLTDPAYLGGLLGVEPDDVRVSTVRYRPGQRHVLRYDGGGATTFAKVYRRGRVPPLGVAALVAGSSGRFVVDDRVLLLDYIKGRPLSGLLRAGDRTAGPLLRKAGAILRTVHETTVRVGDELELVDAAKEVKATQRACEHIHHYLPDVGARIDAITTRVLAVLDATPPEPAVLAHGDYKADHLLVDGDRLTVIDFDSCGRAEPARDIGKMLADLRWWGAEEAQDEFVAGYAPSPETLARAHVYEGLLLVKMAARRVSMLKPDWAGRTNQLTLTCDQLGQLYL